MRNTKVERVWVGLNAKVWWINATRFRSYTHAECTHTHAWVFEYLAREILRSRDIARLAMDKRRAITSVGQTVERYDKCVWRTYFLCCYVTRHIDTNTNRSYMHGKNIVHKFCLLHHQIYSNGKGNGIKRLDGDAVRLVYSTPKHIIWWSS